MTMNIRIESTSKQVMQGELFALLVYFDAPAEGEPASALALRFTYPEEAFEILSVASFAATLFPQSVTSTWANGLFEHVAERSPQGGIMLTSGLYMAITCRVLSEAYRGAIIVPGSCSVAYAGESRLGTVTATPLNPGHTLASLRQEIGRELGEVVTGTVATSFGGSPNSLLSNDLIDDMEDESRYVGSWAWMQTEEGASTNEERRINAYDPVRGTINFSRMWTGQRKAGMDFEIHTMLPPEELNRIIVRAAKSLAYQVTLRLLYTQGVTRYSLAAYPWIETPEQVMGLMVGPSWDTTNSAQTSVPWWKVSMEGGTIYLDIASSSLPGGDTLYLGVWRIDSLLSDNLNVAVEADDVAISASINRRWLVSSCIWRAYEYLTRHGPAQDTARYQAAMTAEAQRFNALSKRFTPRIKAVVRLPSGFNGWRSVAGESRADANLGFITGGVVFTPPTTDIDPGDLDIPIDGDAPSGGSTEDTTVIVTELVVNGDSLMNGDVGIAGAESVSIQFANGLAKLVFKDVNGTVVAEIDALGGQVLNGAAVFNGPTTHNDYVTVNGTLYADQAVVGPSNSTYGFTANTPANLAYGGLLQGAITFFGGQIFRVSETDEVTAWQVWNSVTEVWDEAVKIDGNGLLSALMGAYLVNPDVYGRILLNQAVEPATPDPYKASLFLQQTTNALCVKLPDGSVHTIDTTPVV